MVLALAACGSSGSTATTAAPTAETTKAAETEAPAATGEKVTVDKVIGNQGWSTLTVIGCSMVLFFLLQALLSGTKTYLLAHTTNKLDALLGARLFRHLLSLPLPYYENRQVGESLMRLDALTSIREFLTSKGLENHCT